MVVRSNLDRPISEHWRDVGSHRESNPLERLHASPGHLLREDLLSARDEIVAASELLRAQQAKLDDFGKGLLSIWSLLMGGPRKQQGAGLFNQLERIEAQLERLDERLARLEQPRTAPAPSPLTLRRLVTEPDDDLLEPAPSSSMARANKSSPPQRSAPADRPSSLQDDDADSAFRAAWAALSEALGAKGDPGLKARIDAGAQQSQSSLGGRREALVRSTFRQLATIDPAFTPVEALGAFVERMLGPRADLIVPMAGDRFDSTAQEDYSVRTSGYRDRISQVVLPGVRCGDRVVARAAVRT